MMSSPPPPTTTSSSSSGGNIPVTAIIILSAIVVLSAIVILILRHNKRSAADSSSPTSDVVASRVTPEDPDLSLPIFTYGSIGRSTSNSGDCAVCLSRFVATDRLRLLPLCCHAFHVECIDTWLRSNRSCPLCRSSVDASDESQLLAKAILLSSSADGTSRSFRLEIGSVSRRDPNQTSNRRSYSVGSLDYVFDEEYEVVIQDNKEMATEADVASGRSMLMDYVDRVSLSLSSRAMSFRSSVSFFTGSSRRNEVVVGVGDFDMEVGRAGEEISEMFRWVSGL